MVTDKRAIGSCGEQFVAEYLMRQGYAILARNVAWRGGEIDLVVERGEVVAFVEVKLRQRTYLPVADLVPPGKQHKIVRTSAYFIMKNRLSERSYRFDVALVDTGKMNSAGDPTITYYEHAFTGGIDAIW